MSNSTPHRIDPPCPGLSRAAFHARAGGASANGGGTSRDVIDRQPDTANSPPYQKPRRRIDQAHPQAVNDFASSEPDVPSTVQKVEQEPAPIDEQESWLRLHAVDLIQKLRQWALDLDARETQLSARTSLQALHERQFRLQRQDSPSPARDGESRLERRFREITRQLRRRVYRKRTSSEPTRPPRLDS
jgi:hypothetical protein